MLRFKSYRNNNTLTTPERPELKTIEEINGELVIRFVYDIPNDKKVNWFQANLAAISDAIAKKFKDWYHLLALVPGGKKEARTVLEKHLSAYVAKNTFDYFIHKDLRGFLTRELDFFIKSEVIHLDDIDTTDEKRADSYLAKVKAIKRVGKIIIDFLAQIEDFQKKLWLKKKFVVDTNWCITLDRVDEKFYPEIIENEAQIAEWREMYAIHEIEGNLTTVGYSEPLTIGFLRQNKNLVLDTRHFSADFKERLIASIDNLDEQTGGLLIHSENFQALSLMAEKYHGKLEHIHIDPPYNTETSGFLYKNNYQHSSWASMMFDRMKIADELLQDENGAFQCHIDENEYELLFMLFSLLPRNNAGTIIWNKLNPMLGRKGVATQHEYIIFKSNYDKSIYAKSENIEKLKEYAAKAIAENGGINDRAREAYKKYLNDDSTLTGGERAYNLIDDNGNIYRLVAMGAPEKRLDPKYYIPLIHPITKKPCPVPSNGWSRKPETMAEMISEGRIIFGKDETTQPQKKVVLSEESTKQIASVISDGKSGKAFLDNLGIVFPYAHPVSLYEVLISANNPNTILDYFAGSGTTGHAVLNMNREDGGNRKYILVEMGEYFHTVTLPRMKKVIYSADWKNGKPQNRNTGVSHIMKYITLESYEDTLSNIELDDDKHQLAMKFGDEYMIHYMFDYEAKESMLSLDAFNAPFSYKLKIIENNETKLKTVDLCETFNFLIGLSVIRQSATAWFKAVKLTEEGWKREGLYEGAVRLERDNSGEYGFKQIEGRLPDGRRALVIWRTITSDLIQSNAALDSYFTKHRINPADREFDVIYVNGDNNLENLRLDEENWKVQRIEPVFREKMFEEAE